MDAGKESKQADRNKTVFSLMRASRCHNCDLKLLPGNIVKLENKENDQEALCCKCAGLDKLGLVGKGNAKLTRLASKYSAETFVVMQWSELWKCYERIGILAELTAIERAKQEAEV